MIENYFPKKFSFVIKRALELKNLTEIRVRINKPLMFSFCGDKKYINVKGEITDKKEDEMPIVFKEDIVNIMALMSSSSVYAYKDEIKRGFITLKEGHRAGICGRSVNGGEYIKDITSINIRIARDIKRVSDKFIKNILNNSALIIAPPGCGKTTFLRDVARNLSSLNKNVAIADERCEIAPVVSANAVFDLGDNIDVLSDYKKDLGMLMLLRTMNPDVIITDEIADLSDFKAVEQIVNSGVKVVASFHGGNALEYKNRLEGMGIKRDIFPVKILLNKKFEGKLC